MTVAVMLAFALGLHWTMLQSVGWAGMFFSFARTEPITEALVKTFDGTSPCAVCKMVKEGREAEKEATQFNGLSRLDLMLVRETLWLFPPRTMEGPHRTSRSWPEISLTPPVPPPRFA